MRKVFIDKNGVLKRCHIYQMLIAQKKHLSFHTPGHKQAGWDITELSYSDNLSAPTGCIARAEKDIAEILGAQKSFILTDGSTSGVLSMLHAFATAGYTRLAIPEYAHKSVKNGCRICRITPIEYTATDLMENVESTLKKADGLLLVSPDYYGNIPDLERIKSACKVSDKPLLIDGAHGGHLHFESGLYAGSVADMWVDGVHKSLPALTQGAVVSAKTEFWAERLRESVDIFRTTSPAYPIMASVEYAVKYPRNEGLETFIQQAVQTHPRFVLNGDWTKVCLFGGKYALDIQAELESDGVFAEFCDGDVMMFYLSPATEIRQVKTLFKKVERVLEKYPYVEVECPAPLMLSPTVGETERIGFAEAEGRICAKDCGLFPPCIPLVKAGEKITKEKLVLLQNAKNVFGITDGEITVLKNTVEE